MSDRELIAAAQALIDGDRAEAWRYPTEWELLVARLKIAAQAQAVNGSTSDGYHTFDELYEFRKAYNAAFFNELAANNRCHVHKSWKHHDGEPCFGGGWFIVVAVLPDGQISNHYEAAYWDLFRVPETEKALFEFDGHTGADVIARLCSYKPQAQVSDGETPVAWRTDDYADDFSATTYDRKLAEVWKKKGWWVGALYASPQPAQPCPYIVNGGEGTSWCRLAARAQVNQQLLESELTGAQWSTARKVFEEYANKVNSADKYEMASAYMDAAPQAIYDAIAAAQEQGK